MPQKLKTILIDFILPKRCINCGSYENSFLCNQCRVLLKEYKPESFISREISINWEIEEVNKSKTALTKVFYFYAYEDILHKLIIKYKYGFNHDLSNLIADLFFDSKEFSKVNFKEFDFITFVPSTKQRESWRGFNHSKLIVENIARIKQVSVLEILEKSKSTKPQIELKREKRLSNLHGVFRFKNNLPDLNDKRILIIDDVLTTGSTLEECAKTIKSRFNCKVYGMCLARGID